MSWSTIYTSLSDSICEYTDVEVLTDAKVQAAVLVGVDSDVSSACTHVAQTTGTLSPMERHVLFDLLSGVIRYLGNHGIFCHRVVDC